MAKSITTVAGYEEFKKECLFYKCEEEYPGWTGKEKYIVFSSLTEEEIAHRYPLIAEYIAPYILLGLGEKETVVAFRNNEKKHAWRAVASETGFGYDSETEYHHDICGESWETDLADGFCVKDALSCLSDVQRRRVEMYFFEGFSYAEIAVREGVKKAPVVRSIQAALEKMKKYLS